MGRAVDFGNNATNEYRENINQLNGNAPKPDSINEK